ncbi:MAG: hypothetical protein CVU56_10465 [Deltaproteobacteria bacterium HGW-Deltaproteobacteria-14]|jgi:hypothetical protein|nr:MAG: hypothetical protein CVU56_10465 [Deltaproteobacteria bacterium HGW-Deltaproteobacteria-14]
MNRIAKALERGFPESLIATCGSRDAALADVWRAVESGAYFVGELSIARFLADGDVDAERAAVVAAGLAKHATPERRGPEFLPGWGVDLDTVVCRAYAAAPDVFARSEPSYDDWAQLGLAFVRRRRGEEISTALAERVTVALARSCATDGLIRGRGDVVVQYVDGGGEEVTAALVDEASVHRFARRFDPTDAIWPSALEAAVRENRWGRTSDVASALRTMPLGDLVAQLATRSAPEGVSFGRYVFVVGETLDLFSARTDPPAALFDAGRALAKAAPGTDLPSPSVVAAILAISGAQRALASSASVASDIEEMVAFSDVLAHRALIGAFLDVLRRLPTERSRAWVAREVARSGAAVVGLAACFDATILREALRGNNRIEPEAFGPLGSAALPELLSAANELPPERAARARHAFVFALAEAARAGTPPGEELDVDLVVAAFDGRPMERESYGMRLREATEFLFAAMPEARRRPLMMLALDTAPMSAVAMLPTIESDAELDAYLAVALPDGIITDHVLRQLGPRAIAALRAHGPKAKNVSWVREAACHGLSAEDFAKVADVFVPGCKWRAIEADAARARAAHPDAPPCRVYLLERASFDYPAREGTLSRLGGSVRGLRKGDIPTDANGERQSHVLTLDLEDVPELRTMYPNARALALFCPRWEDGENFEDSALIEISEPAMSARRDSAVQDRALAVFGIDVPARVFDDARSVELDAVHYRIRCAGGHVLGRPMFIYDKPYDEDDTGFVCQIGDELTDELNVGFGSIYVFRDAVFMQGN